MIEYKVVDTIKDIPESLHDSYSVAWFAKKDQDSEKVVEIVKRRYESEGWFYKKATIYTMTDKVCVIIEFEASSLIGNTIYLGTGCFH